MPICIYQEVDDSWVLIGQFDNGQFVFDEANGKANQGD